MKSRKLKVEYTNASYFVKQIALAEQEHHTHISLFDISKRHMPTEQLS
jgi:hypothetical protein